MMALELRFLDLSINTQAPAFNNEYEFHQKYTLEITNEHAIEITERTSGVVARYIANTPMTKNIKFCKDLDGNDWNVYKGVLYFIVGSEEYPRVKYLFSYNPAKKENLIKLEMAALRVVRFYESMLVNFDKNFNQPGDQEQFDPTSGVIKVYDLDKIGSGPVKSFFTKNKTNEHGWEGDIVEEANDEGKWEIKAIAWDRTGSGLKESFLLKTKDERS
jgi:hypothetical protein